MLDVYINCILLFAHTETNFLGFEFLLQSFSSAFLEPVTFFPRMDTAAAVIASVCAQPTAQIQNKRELKFEFFIDGIHSSASFSLRLSVRLSVYRPFKTSFVEFYFSGTSRILKKRKEKQKGLSSRVPGILLLYSLIVIRSLSWYFCPALYFCTTLMFLNQQVPLFQHLLT